MQQSSLWLRVFVGLLIAILPPLIAVVAAVALGNGVLAGASPLLVAIAMVAGIGAWSAILAIVFSRSLGDEFSDLLALARGDSPSAAAEASSAAQRMTALLDERNRQVATLAQEAAHVPINEPVGVVRSMVGAVASVMRDETWRCAVLTSEEPSLLPPGVYEATGVEAETQPVGDLEQWASTVESEKPVRHVEGPWGAFTVVDLAEGGSTSAILYAPWQGRMPPTRAELDLLTLVGKQAGTAVEHSLLYARVRSQADELNRLAAVQADFLRGITHDLQTPLTSMSAVASELRADEAVPESARADLETIIHQADRLRRMVAQLLVASRLEAGVFTPQTEVFAIRPIVERTWAALRAERPFELSESGEAHLAVADPDRVEQVLWAVFDNAVKYSQPGSPISVAISGGNGTLEVVVHDRGTGMDTEARDRAFEQFYRSAQARKLAPDGSGVGLYAARGLMEAMDGSIDLASELGKGTTATITVPAERSDAEQP